MSKSKRVFETSATLYLKAHGVAFIEHTYGYADKGGTTKSSRQSDVDEHHVIKTLVIEDEHAKPLVVLMHGGYSASTKNLVHQIGRKSAQPCKPEVVRRHNGYLIGDTSPSRMRRAMPAYVKASVLELERIYINGGKRGFFVSLVPSVLTTVLNAQPANYASPS